MSRPNGGRYTIQKILTVVMLMFAVISVCSPVYAASSTDGVFNVREFGAKGDGRTIDTEAFRKALVAAKAHGRPPGVVVVPPGRYIINDTLRIPAGVALQGQGGWTSGQQTALLVVGSDFPAVMMEDHTRVQGFLIEYPFNTNLKRPTPHEPTILLVGVNAHVENIQFAYAWDGISTPPGGTPAGHPLFRNIGGFVHNTGIRLEGVMDIVRIENVHWFVPREGLARDSYFYDNRIGFDLYRTDGIMASKVFMIGGRSLIRVNEKHGLSYFFDQVWGEALKEPIVVDTDSPHDIFMSQVFLHTTNRPDADVVVDIRRGKLHLSSYWSCNVRGASTGIRVSGTSELTLTDSWVCGAPGMTVVEIDTTGPVILTGNRLRASSTGVRATDRADNYIITDNVIQCHIPLIDEGGPNKVVSNNLILP